MFVFVPLLCLVLCSNSSVEHVAIDEQLIFVVLGEDINLKQPWSFRISNTLLSMVL